MGTSLGKGNIWSVTVFAPPTVQSLRGSHQEDPRRSGTSASSPSPTSPPPSRSRLVASEASPMSGGTLVKMEMLSHADYVQVNCFVPIQLAKGKSMIAVTGVERFHWEEENTYEGNAQKPSWLSRGSPAEYLGQERPQDSWLSRGSTRRIPWPRARLCWVCARSLVIFLSFSNAIWFSQVSSFVQISQYFLYLSKPLAWGMFHYPQEQSNEMVLSRLPSWELCAPISTSCA